MANTTTSSQQYFRTRPKLLAILQMGGAQGQLFTAEQVVYFLGKYIEKNKLYDSLNKRIIHCGADLLGEVLEVETFTVSDFKNLWKLVFPCLFPATKKELLSSTVEDQQETSSSTDPDLPWWHFVKGRDKNNDEGTEVGSYTGRETILVHDSEYESDDCTTGIEYEPIDDDDDDSDATVPVSTDGEDDYEQNFDAALKYQSDASDDGTTTTDFSIDSDIALERGCAPVKEACANMALLRKDYWSCRECQTRNPPTIGYCQRCWALRKGWLENGMRRCGTDPVTASEKTPRLERSQSLDVCDGSGLAEPPDDHPPNSSETTITSLLPDFPTPKRKLPEASENADAKRPHLDPSSPEATPSSSSGCVASNSSNSSQEAPGLCNICRSNPNNGTIVHRNTGHTFCCYRCAKRLKRRRKGCPVCREPIMLVIKNFILQF